MSEPDVITSPPINWSNFLDQIIRDYETPPARGVAHGLQKDAIQNGWGARVAEKGRDWSFAFVLLASPDGGLFLTMTDTGTTGLIGIVYDNAKEQLPDALPSNEKLARFESMFDSGGNVGPGLFGRGKLIFNSASKDCLIYYDSLTKDGKYRFGKRHIKGRSCEQYKRIFEDDTARSMLKQLTGGILQPLEKPGTRITIVNPVQEVVDAVRDGTFLQAVEETWWEIILKYNAKITVTNEKGEIFHAQVPKEFDNFRKKDENGWKVYYRSNEPVQVGGQELQIKHLHFLLPPAGHTLRQELLGINVYRRGMKIGLLQLSGIPDEISDRFFGYIQLMPDFEDLLAEAENTVHYGFASRNKPAYRSLKKAVQDHLDIFMLQLGYRKPGGDPDLQAKRLMEEAQADLNSILSNMGVPSFGTGTEDEPGVLLSVEDLNFPGGTNYLTTGTEISGFWYLIRNTSTKSASIRVEIFTHERDLGRIETLFEQKLTTIDSGKDLKTPKLKIDVQEKMYPRNKKVDCTALVTDQDGKVIAKKTFIFYVDFQTSEKEEKLATIVLKSAEWPRTDSRRVDYNQSIRNLIYEVENHTAQNMQMRLKVKTLWAAEKEPIQDIVEEDMNLGPFQTKQFKVDQITMTREKYAEVHRGKIILRCHAVALEATKIWEKGTRLAEHNLSFYLNMDPSYGFFEDPEYFDGGSNKPRSEAQPLEGSRLWRLRINKTHPAYGATKANDLYLKDYLFEEMARQTVFVLLRKNQRDSIRKLAELHAEEIDQMEPEDILQNVAYCVTDKILAKYYEGY